MGFPILSGRPPPQPAHVPPRELASRSQDDRPAPPQGLAEASVNADSKMTQYTAVAPDQSLRLMGYLHRPVLAVLLGKVLPVVRAHQIGGLVLYARIQWGQFTLHGNVVAFITHPRLPQTSPTRA